VLFLDQFSLGAYPYDGVLARTFVAYRAEPTHDLGEYFIAGVDRGRYYLRAAASGCRLDLPPDSSSSEARDEYEPAGKAGVS